MDPSRFLGALHSRRVLLMDGAMGTELQRAGIGEGECYELWNLTHPERVRAIHQAYLDAGADILLTNTFQANPRALARHGLLEQLSDIIRAGIDVARSVCGSEHHVVLDVGPLHGNDVQHNSWDWWWLHELLPTLHGVDAVLLETFSGIIALPIAGFLRHATLPPHRELPVLLSLTYRMSGIGPLCGESVVSPRYMAFCARQYNPGALGVNCGRDIGVDTMIDIVRVYRQATGLPLFARPNAGTPTRVGDRWVYPHSPQQMAARLPELLEAGVSMVGGCCGTTPEHIAAFRPVLDAWNARLGLG